MPVTVEYLVLLPESDTFCDSIESFNQLLKVDSTIKLPKKNEIQHKGEGSEFSCGYRISQGEVAEKGQRYYHLTFSWSGDDSSSLDEVDRFSALLKAVRKVIATLKGQVETLWDDVSFYYAKKAYPIIYDIENLLRKLIANFMLINVGTEWVSETSPGEVKEAMDSSKRKDKAYLNVLHTVDFIHLGAFLFKPYPTRTKEELYEKLKSAKETNLSELRTYIPRSNWQRYFAQIVACEDSYLDTRWKELYDLRCKVAHNALLSRIDFDKIQQLAGEIKPKLEDATQKLHEVSVPPDEIESVVGRAPAENEEPLPDDREQLQIRAMRARNLLIRELHTTHYRTGLSIKRLGRARIRNPQRDVTALVQAGLLPGSFADSCISVLNELYKARGGSITDSTLNAITAAEAMTLQLQGISHVNATGGEEPSRDEV